MVRIASEPGSHRRWGSRETGCFAACDIRRKDELFADGGVAEPLRFASLSQPPGPGQGGWPGVPHYATYPAAYYPLTGAAFAPPMAQFSPTPAGGPAWSGYAGPIGTHYGPFRIHQAGYRPRHRRDGIAGTTLYHLRIYRRTIHYQ